MFSYLSKVLFRGLIQFKGNFVDGQNNWKYRDVAPLNLQVPFKHLDGESLGGTPYNGLYREAAPKSSTFFQALGILKGKDFTRFRYTKG